MLSKKLKHMLIRTIIVFIIFMVVIIGAYVYAIIQLRFSIITILTYIFALIASVLIFTFRFFKLQRYLYDKPVKVKTLQRPLELPPVPEIFHGLMIQTRQRIPYFLFKQNKEGLWIYHDVLEAVDQYHTFQMIQYNYTYALIKDTYGHYYITFLDDLEIDHARL